VQRFIESLGRDKNSPWMRLAAGWWKIIFVTGLERRFAEFIEQRLAPTVRSSLESVFLFSVFSHRILLAE
jgi:hypothetical protein